MSDRTGAHPLVTVIVLSYDRPALLERALASIEAQTYPRMELLVVDNRSGSSDEVARVVAAVPSARLLAIDDNDGFTGGMNRGLAAASGDYVYFTEDDIELDPRCLDYLVDYLECPPAVGLAGPIMFNRHAGTIRCAGGRVRLGPVFQMTVRGVSPDDSIQSEPYETGYLPGAMVCARRALMIDLGGFRSDFFMYFEDVDLCERVMERQLAIAIVPAAKVFHHEPPAGPPSALVAYHKHKNLAAVYFLHAPLQVLPVFVVRYGLLGFLRLLVGDRAALAPFVKAWRWIAWHAPRLLADRAARRRHQHAPVQGSGNPEPITSP